MWKDTVAGKKVESVKTEKQLQVNCSAYCVVHTECKVVSFYHQKNYMKGGGAMNLMWAILNNIKFNKKNCILFQWVTISTQRKFK